MASPMMPVGGGIVRTARRGADGGHLKVYEPLSATVHAMLQGTRLGRGRFVARSECRECVRVESKCLPSRCSASRRKRRRWWRPSPRPLPGKATRRHKKCEGLGK